MRFGRASLLDKARSQPGKVREALEKLRTDGLQPTLEAVFSKLDQPLPLGYCNVGRVAGCGSGVMGFEVGDRVVSNGNHAEVVRVPKNLCAKVPDVVADDEAAFTVLAAIGLQGVRLANPTLGETVVVTGLGLIGLVTVQLLRANGCRVVGLDFAPDRLRMAEQFGAEVVDLSSGTDPVQFVESLTEGRGADAVLITAATDSNEPVRQAAKMSRKRGRIVLVGVAGLNLDRADFYEKELTFQVSCSYGPGRYDTDYEEKGFDYPPGFVRWTEQRNLEAVLQLMAEGKLDVRPLISHRFAIDDAPKAYDLILGSEPSLGVLLEYPGIELTREGQTVAIASASSGTQSGRSARVRVGFIGAGNYASRVLIPAFKAGGADLVSIASSGGLSGVHAGRRFGFREATTDTVRLLESDAINTVAVTTRHDSHAQLTLRALTAGKHVFVEKPLCLNLQELTEIESVYGGFVADRGSAPLVMVGFNRRFAPHVIRIKKLLAATVGPKVFVMTVNAGAIPADHWTQDPTVGGGRIVGEACHFIDLLRFLAGAPIGGWQRSAMKAATGDTVSIALNFADGSIGSIHYLANGSKSFPKERLEVFAAGGVLQLDNFRRLRGFGWPGFRRMNLWRQDKGQQACAAAFIQAIEAGAPSPIPFEELIEVSRVSIEVAGLA